MTLTMPIRGRPRTQSQAIPLFTGPIGQAGRSDLRRVRSIVIKLQVTQGKSLAFAVVLKLWVHKIDTRSHLLDQNTYFVILDQKHYAHSSLFRALLLLCLQVKVQEGIQNLTRRVEMDTSNHVSSKEHKNIGKLGFVLFNFIS